MVIKESLEREKIWIQILIPFVWELIISQATAVRFLIDKPFCWLVKRVRARVALCSGWWALLQVETTVVPTLVIDHFPFSLQSDFWFWSQTLHVPLFFSIPFLYSCWHQWHVLQFQIPQCPSAEISMIPVSGLLTQGKELFYCTGLWSSRGAGPPTRRLFFFIKRFWNFILIFWIKTEDFLFIFILVTNI